ncbi:hypothetical protein C9J21_19995 [Photobacterium phosphoreum]|uniref:hypothetical protein n=1 Tax=Photobacterium phosphoreum TaxID=659 RepID=UPI000D15DB1C|nr:hypothetical protein [Photobacterium phosphoreum]PSW29171.1 hypothetical protein C9J21_19995 [Photobacterium phosphoreum]
MAGVRFDEAYLTQLLAKRKEWTKRGVKAGHGGDFNLKSDMDRDCSTSIKRIKSSKKKHEKIFGTPPISDRYLCALKQGIDTKNLPEWLVNYINEDDELATAITTKNFIPESPHKKRLVDLAKDPTLLTGRKATPTQKAKRASPEHFIQVRIFYLLERDYPFEYQFIKAVPNGGLRLDSVGYEMLAEGQKKGSLDIDIDLPKGCYHGMKLEVKSENGVLSLMQKEKLELLSNIGYHTTFKKGFDNCWIAIMNYLALPLFDNKTKISE